VYVWLTHMKRSEAFGPPIDSNSDY